jgi:protein transport protein SEC23
MNPSRAFRALDAALTASAESREAPHRSFGRRSRRFRRRVLSIDARALPSSLQSSPQAIAVFFQFSRDLPPDAYAHAQFASWDVTPTGTRVARVVSIRIPTVRTKREYLAAVDNTVAGILAGKKAALDAANESIGRLGAAKRLRARVMHLAEVFSPPSAPPPNRPFPGALREFAEAMYHACRGGMLSEMLGHADERAAARGIFLSAGVDVAAPMLSPRLFKRDGAGGAGGFVSVPASDLALCGDAVLFLDAGDCVFGWVGREVASDAARSRDARETLAAFGKRLTRDRFPIPSLKIVTEGSSQARYVVSRLAPGHVDAEHEQNVWFPPIAALAPEARKKLMASFLPTEEPSFALWMRGLGLRIRDAGDDDVTLAVGGGEIGVGFNTQIV